MLLLHIFLRKSTILNKFSRDITLCCGRLLREYVCWYLQSGMVVAFNVDSGLTSATGLRDNGSICGFLPLGSKAAGERWWWVGWFGVGGGWVGVVKWGAPIYMYIDGVGGTHL